MIDNIDKYELVSFDIFDTLLLRGVAKPTDIFQIVWERAKAKGLCLTDLSSCEFMKLRIEMERRARNKVVNKEVKLEDIYTEFPDFITSNINELKVLELTIEKEYCYINFDIYNLLVELKKQDKYIVLLSDMYLSINQIKEILTYNGVDISNINEIIVSCEENSSKQSGDLYNKLFERFPNISKERILHIGDNKIGDYKKAIENGIQAFHYDAIPEKMNSIYDYERIQHNTPQREILSLRKAVSFSPKFHSKDVSMDMKNAFELGASIIGPFLTNYISWVCDELEKLKIKRIYPLMREGYLLGELLKREALDRGFSLHVKPIYISRKVTYLPSIEKVNREEIENMIGARNLTLGESIDLMGLDRMNFQHFDFFMDLKIKETHKIAYEDGNLKEAIIVEFLKPHNIQKSEMYIKEQRYLLNNYLIQEIEDFRDIATIDIGFMGRIQMWMEKSLDLDDIAHNIKHFLAVGVTGDKIFNGINITGYYGTISENSDLIQVIHRTTDIIEKLISVSEGSTIGYMQEDNKIVPIKSDVLNHKKYLDVVFNGILTYQNYWFEFRKQKPNLAKTSLENRREMLMLLHRLFDMPRLEEVLLLEKFEGDTNFGTSYKKCIITDENKALLEEKGLEFINKCNVSYTYQDSNIVWPKGLITLFDEFYYVRKAMKNSAGNDTLLAMQEVIEKIVEQGIKEVSLYGAGENGRQFYFVCKIYNIQVNCFIDRKESLWGSKKEGVEVMGLKDAISRDYNTYIITSLFSISEIKEYILENYKNSNRTPIIFSV